MFKLTVECFSNSTHQSAEFLSKKLSFHQASLISLANSYSGHITFANDKLINVVLYNNNDYKNFLESILSFL